MSKFSLYVGNLSVHTKNEDLIQLFSSYGEIMDLRLKKSRENEDPYKFGFVDFSSPKAAADAKEFLNGNLFKGKPLRILWASNSKRESSSLSDDYIQDLKKYSLHVNFLSYQTLDLVTEEKIRGIFSNYGEIMDIIIKNIQIDKELNCQRGYGFVCFDPKNHGIIEKFLTALKDFKDEKIIENVSYRVDISNSSKYHITTGFNGV